MKKTYTFRLNEKEVTLKSQGNSIKIFLEGSLISTTLYPNLFGGQDIEVKIDDTDYVFSCKSSSFGFKLRVEVYSGGNLITDNGVILKENAQKIDTKKSVIEDTHKSRLLLFFCCRFSSNVFAFTLTSVHITFLIQMFFTPVS